MEEQPSERLKDKVGVEWKLGIFQIERGMIRRFVRAIGDSNPLWQDGEVAPPTFVLTLGFEDILQEWLASTGSGTLLHGSTELECYKSIRAGDKIASTAKIANIRERQGKTGKISFVTLDITHMNQNRELVAKCRQMIIQH